MDGNMKVKSVKIEENTDKNHRRSFYGMLQ